MAKDKKEGKVEYASGQEEIKPEVAKPEIPDGLKVKITQSPDVEVK